MTFLGFVRQFRRDQRGISAVEYAILIGVVGVGLVGVLTTANTNITGYVTGQITALTNPAPAQPDADADAEEEAPVVVSGEEGEG